MNMATKKIMSYIYVVPIQIYITEEASAAALEAATATHASLQPPSSKLYGGHCHYHFQASSLES